MKVYLRENSVAVIGKPWQVKLILRKYMEDYDTVQEWINDSRKSKRADLKRIK